ncbi:hypothetical protein K488DRAFT_41416, partial [Vararia minispora EC-137]
LNLAEATTEQLQSLAKACMPATFGRGSEDVFDESYRKAGKLDASYFSTRIVPERTRLLDTVRGHLLEGKASNRPIVYELYKLNVYGEGSFFKAHVDTPRGTHMFGSLVLIFPTPHMGGNLILRHGGKELNFDSAAAVSGKSGPSVAFAAFFSDVEHEVLPVTSGVRVTLTFNLYYGDMESPFLSTIPRSEKKEEAFRRAFETFIANEEMFPNGGGLGFALQHIYPVSTSDQDLSHIPWLLKGFDSIIYSVSKALGFKPKIYMRFQTTVLWAGSRSYFLIDRPLDLAQYKSDESVIWISEPAMHHLEKQAYMTYGNESQVMYAYRDLYIVVRIGKPGHRLEYRTEEDIKERIKRKRRHLDYEGQVFLP